MAPILVRLLPVSGTDTVELLQTPTFPIVRLGAWACNNKTQKRNITTRALSLMVIFLFKLLVFDEFNVFVMYVFRGL